MNQCFPEIRRQRWEYRKVLQPPWTWEALLHSQNQISYGFLSNAASSVSLNSLLFASTDSLHWTKIQEWNLITIESVLPRRPGMRAHAARDGIRVFVWWSCFFTNLQNSFWRPWAPGSRGKISGACIQGFMAFLPAKDAFRPEYSRYTWQTGRESFHGVSWFPSPYIYIA